MRKFLIILFIIIAIAVTYSVNRQRTEITTSTSPSQNTEAGDAASVIVGVPSANSAISSPVTITGRARGFWFFEAHFPVEIVDGNGMLLGTGAAQASGEWMTEEYVPFSAAVTFARSTTTKGYILFKKDNPSGLPENDATIAVPITFAQ